MIDREKFIELLQAELKRQGYDCIQENGEIKVSKNGFNIADILGSGEYRVYRNTLNDNEYHQIRAICESLSEAYRLYEQGEPVAAQPQYHMLCEFGNHLLAAKLMGYGYMEFVTWQQDAEKTRVDIGHYMTDYEAAKEDLAVRAGLIDRNKQFNETEMKLIRQGLVHLGANFPELTYEQNTLLGRVVEKIEMLVPSIQEHEELEHEALVPDDGLEIYRIGGTKLKSKNDFYISFYERLALQGFRAFEPYSKNNIADICKNVGNIAYLTKNDTIEPNPHAEGADAGLVEKIREIYTDTAIHFINSLDYRQFFTEEELSAIHTHLSDLRTIADTDLTYDETVRIDTIVEKIEAIVPEFADIETSSNLENEADLSEGVEQ